MTIRQALSREAAALTTAERRAARTLLANYPSAGLSAVAALAKRAGVSVPTVLRLVAKLGFPGYAAFQATLIDEVSEQLNSPLSLLGSSDAGVGGDIYRAMMLSFAEAMRQAAADHRPADFDAAVDLLADERCDVYCLGGRFSAVLARRLAGHLGQLRPRVELIENHAARLFDPLVDFNSRSLLVVYDYRRYQADVIAFARLAHEARSRILLFTDRWMSPIAAFADHVLVAPVESPSPFDSKVVAVAQGEAIVAALVQRSPDKARERLAAIEALRSKGAAAAEADPS